MEKRWAIPANVYHYTSMVTCLLKAGQWSEAIAMTDRMEVRWGRVVEVLVPRLACMPVFKKAASLKQLDENRA